MKTKKIMKKAILMLAMVLPMVLTSCSDEGNIKTIKNLTGVSWHDAQIWFMESTEAESMVGYQEIGYVGIGESCEVDSESAYFYVYAKDSRGRTVMSRPKRLSEVVSVYEDDLF